MWNQQAKIPHNSISIVITLNILELFIFITASRRVVDILGCIRLYQSLEFVTSERECKNLHCYLAAQMFL